jgi:DNA-binding CsgD family transcriptional regulator
MLPTHAARTADLLADRIAERIENPLNAWGALQRRPLRRVPLAPESTPAPAPINARASEQQLFDLTRLWREIQDLPAHEVDAGLQHLLPRLCSLAAAQGVRWELLGATRPGQTVCMASQHWQEGVAAKVGESLGGPVLSITLPLQASVRMHFTLMRNSGSADFNATDRQMLELTLAGLTRWLSWLAHSHGPVTASGPMPPHQRKVLLLLVTGLAEKQIADQLNLSTNTAHQYVTALYRRFGVRNRPSLAALWLGAA